jgi:hypothetical protein
VDENKCGLDPEISAEKLQFLLVISLLDEKLVNTTLKIQLITFYSLTLIFEVYFSHDFTHCVFISALFDYH